MKVLEKYGRLSIALRPHLRPFIASKQNKNQYLNDLIEKDYKPEIVHRNKKTKEEYESIRQR